MYVCMDQAGLSSVVQPRPGRPCTFRRSDLLLSSLELSHKNIYARYIYAHDSMRRQIQFERLFGDISSV